MKLNYSSEDDRSLHYIKYKTTQHSVQLIVMNTCCTDVMINTTEDIIQISVEGEAMWEY